RRIEARAQRLQIVALNLRRARGAERRVRDLAPPFRSTAIGRRVAGMKDDLLAIAIGAEAGMVVDEANPPRTGELLVEDANQRPPRRRGRPTAEEEPVRMIILSAAHRLLQRRGAALGGKGFEARIRGTAARLVPLRGADRVGEEIVLLVARQGSG